LGDGIGDGLQRALRDVDDVLGLTVGQLRKTLAESNETIERLSGPIRAAEGSTRETHVALDRVRAEVEALGQWMAQAVKPLRSGLSEVESRAEEIARTMVEFSSHTRQIDKTKEALREGIHEESRRLQGTGSELSRSLKLASDSRALIEGGASDAAQRARPESGSGSRERSWSAAPHARGESANDLVDEAHLGGGAESRDTAHGSNVPGDASSSGAPASLASTVGADVGQAAGDAPASGAETPSADGTASGYRVGAPRAQGPDPYGRFEGESEPASNVRHFPTPDRELGDDLKLSGLLGPSHHHGPNPDAEDSAGVEDAAGNRSGKGAPGSAGKSGRRRGNPPTSADESD